MLCASEMKIWYGQGGADWDQAKRVMERMKGNAAAQNRAKGAFALASGDVSKARQILSPLSESDAESAWLFSQVLMRVGEVPRAGQVLERALKGTAATTPLLHYSITPSRRRRSVRSRRRARRSKRPSPRNPTTAAHWWSWPTSN